MHKCKCKIKKSALNINHVSEACPQTLRPLSLEPPNMTARDLIKLIRQSVSKVNPFDILSQSSPLLQDQIKPDSAGLPKPSFSWIIQYSFGKGKAGFKYTVDEEGLFYKIHH